MRVIAKAFLTGAIVTLATQAIAINITIQNSSFENPTATGSFDTVPGATTIPGWTVSAGTVDHIISYWPAADGVRSIDLNGNSQGAISQDVSIPVAGTLYIDFYMAGNPDGAPSTKHLRVSLAGFGFADFTYDMAVTGGTRNDMKWAKQTATFIVEPGTYALEFASMDAGYYGAALDSVSANIFENQRVPEGGATLILLGTGLVGLAAVRRKLAR